MEYQVSYSAAAKRDIESIYNYISHTLANPASATAIIDQILKKCDALSLFPEVTPIRYARHDREYRLIQVHHYMVVYTIAQSPHTVTIHRILYSRRDISAILPCSS